MAAKSALPKHKMPAQARQCKPQYGGINLSRRGSLGQLSPSPKPQLCQYPKPFILFNLSLALKVEWYVPQQGL